jgi:hypothetical protein
MGAASSPKNARCSTSSLTAFLPADFRCPVAPRRNGLLRASTTLLSPRSSPPPQPADLVDDVCAKKAVAELTRD